MPDPAAAAKGSEFLILQTRTLGPERASDLSKTTQLICGRTELEPKACPMSFLLCHMGTVSAELKEQKCGKKARN